MVETFTAAEIAEIKRKYRSGASEVRLRDRGIRYDGTRLQAIYDKVIEYERHGAAGRPRVQLIAHRG